MVGVGISWACLVRIGPRENARTARSSRERPMPTGWLIRTAEDCQAKHNFCDGENMMNPRTRKILRPVLLWVVIPIVLFVAMRSLGITIKETTIFIGAYVLVSFWNLFVVWVFDFSPPGRTRRYSVNARLLIMVFGVIMLALLFHVGSKAFSLDSDSVAFGRSMLIFAFCFTLLAAHNEGKWRKNVEARRL